MLNLGELGKLGELGDRELLCALESALGSERAALARLVVYLGEVEQRRIHLVQGYASLFEFCTVELRLSEGEAFRRINAARLARRFPMIVELLATGAQHLSGLVLLRDHLTERSHAELLAESSNKSKRQIEVLLAARAPKPDVPARIRKLPNKQPSPSVALPGLAARPAGPEPEPDRNCGPEPDRNCEPEPDRKQEHDQKPEPEPELERRRERDRARLEPLSSDRYKLQLTVSAQLRDKLMHATNLMSHANPSRDLAVVVERAIDLLIEKLETVVLAKRKTGRAVEPRPAKDPGAAEPRPAKDPGAVEPQPAKDPGAVEPRPAKDPGAVPRRERRAVFERDGMQCTYVGPGGRRCTSKALLQLDHVKERARGGVGRSPNLRVLCRAHNLLEAERSFGREHIERCIDFSRRKRKPSRTEPSRSTTGDEAKPPLAKDADVANKLVRGQSNPPLAKDSDVANKLVRGQSNPPLAKDADVANKLVQVLTGLGFTRARSLATVKALCAERGSAPWRSPIEDLLRAAVQMASS